MPLSFKQLEKLSYEEKAKPKIGYILHPVHPNSDTAGLQLLFLAQLLASVCEAQQ